MIQHNTINSCATKGLINDTISDMLTRIRNASLAKKSSVFVPNTNLTQQIAQILEKEGFIQNFQVVIETQKLATSHSDVSTQNKTGLVIRLKYRSKKVYNGKKKESCITNLRRISKPGLRIYANSREIPRILGGTGLIILSTPEGLMTDREARSRSIGGELLCSIW